MFLGESVVAQAWSFSNDIQEIPYLIKRTGRPKTLGGTGYKWTCSCPASTFRRGTCKHILALRESARIGFLPLDKRFNVSDFGKEALKTSF